MKRMWNFFYYCTWFTLAVFGNFFILKPIVFFMMKLLPFTRNNKKRGVQIHKDFMNNIDYGTNIGFAFGFMFNSTMVLLTSISIYIFKYTNLEAREYLFHFAIGIAGLSYITNYLLIYYNDTYKTYFKEFNKRKEKKKVYMTAIFFHGSLFFFLVLSAYFIIGFNF